MQGRFFGVVQALCLTLLLCILFLDSAFAAPLTLYVSPQGNDTWTGRRSSPDKKRTDGPLATLEAARNAIRKIKPLPKGGVVVEVAGGTYQLIRPLELDASDSGTAGSPIVYRAAAKTPTVRLTGGRLIAKFTPVTDAAVREKLPLAARNRILQTDLETQGVMDFGALSARGFGQPIREAGLELFYNDKPMPIAGWPNQNGFTLITSVPAGTNGGKFGFDLAVVTPDRAKLWAEEKDLWVFDYGYHDWADSYVKVASVDAAGGVLTLAPPSNPYGYRAKQRFRVLNALSELDTPGEWYLDRSTGILYFFPPAPLTPKSRVEVSVIGKLVEMKGVSDVTLRGFTFEAARGTGITISGGMRNRVVSCILRNMGNRAVLITDNATDSGVVGCDIYETGDGGIGLSGGDRKTLTPAHLYADNNHIHDYSRWCRTYRPAIEMLGVGIRATHNLIHDGPHNAILLHGNDHLVAFNEIHNVCYETGDVGALYTGHDWTARGTVIKNNYFHDVTGPGIYGAMGVYLDDQASGFTVTGNIFVNVTRAVFIGGGDDNLVDNNIFVNCTPAVHLDARGLDWQKPATDDPKGNFRTLYAEMPVTGALWSRRYPNLTHLLDKGAPEPGAPWGNLFARNIAVGGKWEDVETKARPGVTFTDNFINIDPLFVDAARGDYRLKAASPAVKKGFKPIPVQQIGLRNTADRATWPPVHPVKTISAPMIEK